MKTRKKFYSFLISLLAVSLLFVLDCNNEVAASTLTESKQDSPVTQSMPAPYRVWYSIPFKVGNLPPKTQFLTVSMYNARYRGYLGITNRTDGRGAYAVRLCRHHRQRSPYQRAVSDCDLCVFR